MSGHGKDNGRATSKATTVDDSAESLRVMFAAASTPEQIEAYFACGRVVFRKVLPNGYIARIEVKAPGSCSKATLFEKRKKPNGRPRTTP